MSAKFSARTWRALTAVTLAGVLAGGAAAAPVESATAAPTVTAAPAPSGWLHTSGGSILTASGDPYLIKGVSWFGLETSNCAPHGLWTISLAAGLAQIKSMGFTTVRVPFSNECLAAAATSSINSAVNPDLVGKTPQQVLDILISTAAAAGLNVILDRHRPDSGSQSELWYTDQYSEARWIADWTALATRYRNDPTVIGVDLHNEPHGPACWGCGNAATDWQAAATRGGNAVLAANPNLLILVEGIENQASGTSTWWGGGLSGVAAKPVTLSVPNRVVYSPHDYPASVYPQTWFAAADYPANLTSVWDANWGYISKRGIAPVLVGEFGSKLETNSDTQWMNALVGYLATNKISFAYWSFNPNSGDTGGIIADDWVTPQAAKLAVLAPLLAGTAGPVPVPTATPTPTATPKPPATPKPTPTPTPTGTPTATPAAGATVAWNLQSSWGAGYVADLVVTGTTGVSGWTVSWPDTTATGIVNAWGMTCTLEVKVSVTCTGADWAGRVASGQSVRVGLQVAASGAPTAPKLTVTTR